MTTKIFSLPAIVLLLISSSVGAQSLDSMGFTRAEIHEAVLAHERDPLNSEWEDMDAATAVLLASPRKVRARGFLMAHFKPLDYIVCGDIVGPLFESDVPGHQAIAWQIIFASGDWVEENPEQGSDIDAYTLVGLESGLRAYRIALQQDPSVQHQVLDYLKKTGAVEFNQEFPCRAL